MRASPTAARNVLLCRAGPHLVGLPLGSVRETMRPLRTDPIDGAPSSVRGLAMIRGAPTPVLDVAALIVGERGSVGRFVLVEIDGRPVALALSSVLDVVAIDSAALSELPPLLHGARGAGVADIQVLDGALILALEPARLIPPELARQLMPRAAEA